ncbi:hypothetical protein V6B08_08445 [Ferrovibrio sp. MS7]|uniref:hypothetical protein n=1 Tax=Ferrovibrio plantarum TaxID=3119164 RepID=UPI003134AF06
MPFVQRNWKGEVTGLFSLAQAGHAEEELSEDNPEVIAFRQAHPVPPELLRPLTHDERRKINHDHDRLKTEHTQLRNAIWAFNATFNEMELALSALLYSALDIKHSQVAYAIYYSPNGFDARTEIVDNVIKQLINENPRIADLSPLWSKLYEDFRSTRKMRNNIAHGMPVTLTIRGRNHARLCSPVFDQNRVGRHIAKTGQPPGLTASSIMQGAKKARWQVERVDDVNRLFATFHEVGNPTLPQKFAALEEGLRTKDNH